MVCDEWYSRTRHDKKRSSKRKSGSQHQFYRHGETAITRCSQLLFFTVHKFFSYFFFVVKMAICESYRFFFFTHRGAKNITMVIVFHSWQSKNITGQFILVVSDVFHKSPFPETLPYARKVIFTMCFVSFVTQCFPLQQSCFHCPHIFLRSASVLRIDFFGKHCVHVIKHCHMYDLSLCGGNHFPSFVWFCICDKQIIIVDILF